ncbi:baseplate J/gp47 family protein [Alkalilimnicola ehrlichii MLHE-1]|uniref:Uncharacterized protein n=1 Tax=Alkalilimnicola ehrlichii (strain ATCC BAA-1101 / DSM 17681 / MLHE-1) TaxID=187272 RepID=Q0A7U6_ALKEH|nr:baseplate J/gp47 family protein [Alkalilimnicola ehrlichii]ABI57091.1 conserved hypothetical protein [Alkalilimnicola ehrlichii MLHE-1]
MADDDLTRWNRAGLSRFRYLDGNAATFLEELRAGLQARFPRWPAVAGEGPPEEDEREWRARLERHYQADRDDLLWQIGRGFARASHVLGEHLDVYANEATLGTAGEWENLRKLVAMLDYHPRPPASAHTTLAVLAKKAGPLAAGFAVKHSPADGAPVVFETLTDLDLDPVLNAVRPADHDRNPAPLQGQYLELAGEHDKLTRGTPLVVEDTRRGSSRAHLIQSVTLDEARGVTRVRVSPRLSSRYRVGDVRVHVLPKERLAVTGPVLKGAVLGHSLRLGDDTGDLKPGETLVLSNPGHKARFLRVDRVRPRLLSFKTPLGKTYLAGARLSRPVEVPVVRRAGVPWRRRIEAGDDKGKNLYVVFVAGDWHRLQNQWVARRPSAVDTALRSFKVTRAHYQPVGVPPEADDSPAWEGYTALSLVGDELDNNPQYLLAVPESPGPWAPDPLLERAEGGVRDPLISEHSKHAAPGDFAVLVCGGAIAWARLGAVAEDEEGERTTHHAAGGAWRDSGGGPIHPDSSGAREGGPFYRDASQLFVHFTETVRLHDGQRNPTPLRGRTLPVSDPDGVLAARLGQGHRLLLDNGSGATTARVVKLEGGDPLRLTLSEPLPDDSRHDNLVLYGNAVPAGHGSGKPEQALGSGDATERHPAFELAVKDVSFVADPSQASGVRAAVEVTVDDRRWTQIANLKDAGPEDAVYTARLTEDGTLQVRFGDGRHGRRLPTGTNNVRIHYRQGVGTRGNLPPGSLTQPQRPHPRVASVRQPLPAGGGADREPEADLRESAPATLLTLSRAVSLRDFARLARAHASIWQANAFSRPTRRERRESLEVVVVPAEGARLTSELRDQLTRYLGTHGVPGVDLRVEDYVPVVIGLDITLRIDLDAFDPEPVIEAVRAALEEAFSLRRRRLGQPLYRGEVFQVVEGVRGVANSSCEIRVVSVGTEGEADGLRQVLTSGGVVRVLQPGPRQCLHLAPGRPDIAIETEAYQP